MYIIGKKIYSKIIYFAHYSLLLSKLKRIVYPCLPMFTSTFFPYKYKKIVNFQML